jgi:hypothetical protein
VALPDAALAPAPPSPSPRLAELEARLRQLTSRGEAHDRLAAVEHALEGAQRAALIHAEEMRAAGSRLAERDAYIAELEAEAEPVAALRDEAARARAQADAAEARERAARRRVAELEGAILRLEHGGGVGVAASSAEGAQAAALAERVAALEAEAARLKQKTDDAQREAWAHLKARSDAEAAAAEVREDTVRKLKDARKIANAELMRAMEEATRKAVTLKEELTRTERERKEAVAALAELRAAAARPAPADEALREATDELARLGHALDGERARLGAIEEGLGRALARTDGPGNGVAP